MAANQAPAPAGSKAYMVAERLERAEWGAGAAGEPLQSADGGVHAALVQDDGWRGLEKLEKAPGPVKANRNVVRAAIEAGASRQRPSRGPRMEKLVAVAASTADTLPTPPVSKREMLERLERAGWAGADLLRAAPRDVREDKNCVVAALKGAGWRALEILRAAPAALRADQDVVLAAVKEDGGALAFASPALRASESVVHTAVGQSGLALRDASGGLRFEHRQLAQRAIGKDWRALGHASITLHGEPDAVLAQIGSAKLASDIPAILRAAAPALLADRKVISAATKRYGEALGWASAALQADRRLVLAAVRQSGLALRHAAPDLRADRPLVVAAVRQHGDALGWASAALQADGKLQRLAAAQRAAGRHGSTTNAVP